MAKHIEKVRAHAERKLRSERKKVRTRLELIRLYRRFLKIEEHRIRLIHGSVESGLHVARRRAELLDVVLQNLFAEALEESGGSDEGGGSGGNGSGGVAIVATGGYGRGLLNPGSDVDLLFLTRNSAGALPDDTQALVGQVLQMLWDVNFKVGHAVRSVRETFRRANSDNQAKSSLIEARFLIGDRELFEDFSGRFRRECIIGREEDYLEARRRDLRSRYAKYSNTVYLQEPHVKNGCGGLRDYHNLLWISYVKRGTLDLSKLVDEKILSLHAWRELEKAYDFLHRVRNELHYVEGRATDILTLRLQGVIATNFRYPQRTILRRCEEFMRDYYMHTRNMFQHSTSMMERFELEQEEERAQGIISFLALRNPKVERFDGFFSKGGRIYPEAPKAFEEDSNRLMRVFQHVQQRHLELSPQIRQAIKRNWSLIDRPFRYRKSVRETFEAILTRKGDVARTLRLMHRTGVLGRYLPEFGKLTCLVQHEFFHRYTADEHTLTCIDKLDELSDTSDPKLAFFQDLFHEMDDPFVLYLALIMHDTGRAADVREHADASATLASRVCRRLNISLERRRLLIFLVDHHLTFWRTATTQNIQDPNVIAEFASRVRNRDYLDALFLLSYADSKGTNEEAWSDWKESLMRQLYSSTTLYFSDQGAFESQSAARPEALQQEVEAKLPREFAEEITDHFRFMPPRYFRFRDPESIVRHIREFRAFFEHFSAGGDVRSLTPSMRWIAQPERGASELIVCSWDRPGLLAHIAGALASQRINILSADLFTRQDDLVLDIIRVCTTDFEPVTDEGTKRAVQDLLVDACTTQEFDFSDLIRQAASRRRSPEPVPFNVPTRVFVTNDANPDYTVIELQALDRIGLLYDVFRTVAEAGFSINYARINTEKGAAIDTLYVTDADGKKIRPASARRALSESLDPFLGGAG